MSAWNVTAWISVEAADEQAARALVDGALRAAIFPVEPTGVRNFTIDAIELESCGQSQPEER